jgi:DNA-binding MarR family transcriptional regulator
MSNLARNTDPRTSHLAAADIVTSGTREQHQAEVRRLVTENPGCTFRELAQYSYLDCHQIGRRLKEVEEQGYIKRGFARTCFLGGKMSTTWLPVENDSLDWMQTP